MYERERKREGGKEGATCRKDDIIVEGVRKTEKEGG